ncbi:MAG: hypothetical protein WAV51_00465 [Microgenomates group bacterium]
MKQQLIMKYAKNLLLLSRSTIFYQKMFILISEELPAYTLLSKRARDSFLNTMGLAISHLHVDLATQAIELVFSCNREHLKVIKQMLIISKSDCEKILIINSFLHVENAHNIVPLLQIQWKTANGKQQETIASHITTFIQRNAAFQQESTDLWQRILNNVQNARSSICSKTAKEHLNKTETLINEYIKLRRCTHEIHSQPNI